MLATFIESTIALLRSNPAAPYAAVKVNGSVVGRVEPTTQPAEILEMVSGAVPVDVPQDEEVALLAELRTDSGKRMTKAEQAGTGGTGPLQSSMTVRVGSLRGLGGSGAEPTHRTLPVMPSGFSAARHLHPAAQVGGEAAVAQALTEALGLCIKSVEVHQARGDAGLEQSGAVMAQAVELLQRGQEFYRDGYETRVKLAEQAREDERERRIEAEARAADLEARIQDLISGTADVYAENAFYRREVSWQRRMQARARVALGEGLAGFGEAIRDHGVQETLVKVVEMLAPGGLDRVRQAAAAAAEDFTGKGAKP